MLSDLGGGSSLLGTIGSYAGWAAAAVSVMNHFTELNQESGRNNIYSAENGTTQIGNALNGNVFNDPITGWLSGAVNGNDSTRSSMAYLDAALANGNWDEIMKAGLASGIEASFTDPIINALAGNQIAKLFGFGQQSPRAGLFAGNHGSYPSSEYFYQTAFQDIGDPSGMANTLTSYFDTRFASLNQSTPNNINTLLRQNGDWGQSAWVDPTAFGGDNQAMVNSIEKQVFKSLADNLVQDLTGAGSGGKSIFGLAFFDDFATEGERAFDTFTRFAGIVNETDGFMVRITDQMNDFGVSDRKSVV